MTDRFRNELEELRDAGLYRELRPTTDGTNAWVTLEGRRVLLLCSNDYLGLAGHPALADAAARAAREWGVGAGASRLVSGSLRIHNELETRLARLKHTEAALLFPSGYHANIGAVTALVGKGDAVFSDALNHASIIDGCRLSGARVHVYAHADADALRSALHASAPARRRLVVTDSVFSMDGDRAPLAELCAVAAAHDAMLMVDEAHATGVLGASGGGLVEELGVGEQVTAQIGTLGKALGCAGAFVAGSRSLIALLVNRARSFIYTTAMPPPTVAAALAALDVVAAEPERRARVLARAAELRGRLDALGHRVPPGDTPILPVMVGGSRRAVAWSDELLRRGVLARAIRPPTVPPDTARLRVTAMATHTPADVDHAVDAFAALAREVRATARPD
jgi:8-amino-7-oxononanoate synthase